MQTPASHAATPLNAISSMATRQVLTELAEAYRAATGVVLALAVALLGQRYIGLGIPVMLEAFQHPLPLWDSLGKLVFTAASLGSGFKGGEVTPLFFIGATLGNALAPLLQLPFGMLAALGFVGVGLRPPTAELGLMMTEALPYYDAAPWLLAAPVIVLVLVVSALQSATRQALKDSV